MNFLKFITITIWICIVYLFYSSYENNPSIYSRWNINNLKGKSITKVIDLLGVSDEINQLKGYMLWIDYKNHKKLHIVFDKDNLIAKYVTIKNINFLDYLFSMKHQNVKQNLHRLLMFQHNLLHCDYGYKDYKCYTKNKQ